MRTIEIEKTAGGQVRLKWSTSPNSEYIINGMNVRVYSSGQSSINNITIELEEGIVLYSFDLSQITTINGAAAPSTVEATLLLITDSVFGG